MSRAPRKSAESFTELVGEVEPLAPSRQSPQFGRLPKQRRERRIAAQNSRSQAAQRGQTLYENFDALPPGELQAMSELRLRIVREWDLHGCFVDEARQLLGDALDERRNRQAEYWLIVHGKGRNSSPYDKAPLKKAVFDLLCGHTAVAAAVSVIDGDGSSGAVAVKIRARRPPPA